MHTEQINDPIEVIVHFSEKSIHPLRFQWNGRAYKITKILYKWDIREGDYKTYRFRVQAGTSVVYEIIFNTEKMRWKLETVQLEG